MLDNNDFAAIRHCVAEFLQLSDNAIVPEKGLESDSATALNQPDTP